MRVISGKFKNHPLQTPKGAATRPTSAKLREAVFNICQHYVEEAKFLDLFAGSGAMGIEALSRGASKAVFVEQSLGAFHCIQENIEQLKLEGQAQLLKGDVWKMLDKLVKAGEKFNLIYVDPPYNLATKAEFWDRLEQSLPPLLATQGIVFVEQGKDSQIPTLGKLKLINSRKMGAAALHQFQKEEP